MDLTRLQEMNIVLWNYCHLSVHMNGVVLGHVRSFGGGGGGSGDDDENGGKISFYFFEATNRLKHAKSS